MNPQENTTPSKVSAIEAAAAASTMLDEEIAAWPTGLPEPSPLLQPPAQPVLDPNDPDDPPLDETKLEVERLEGRQEAGRE
jgi:hypothetical protein